MARKPRTTKTVRRRAVDTDEGAPARRTAKSASKSASRKAVPKKAGSKKSPTRRGVARKPASSKGAFFHRGSAARGRVDDEIEKQKASREQGNQPFRFYCPVGETKQFIIVDAEPDFFLYEHNMKDPVSGKWGFHVPCIKEFDNCPVCEQVGESYYAMFLTVIDLTPFTTRQGIEVEFSRKLLVVKPSQQKKFIRRFEKEGTLRGALFEVARDKPLDAAIGGDIEFMEMVDEEELLSYERSWKDQQGKTHVEKAHEPIDYESIFDEPTKDRLLALVGGEPTPGSSRQVRNDLEDDEDDTDDDWEEDEEDEEDEDAQGDLPLEDDEEEEGDEDEEYDEEEEEPEEEVEEKPAPRRRRRR